MTKALTYLLLCVVFFSSCAISEPEIIANDNLVFKGMRDSILDFSIDIHIHNPTGYNYELRELYFDIAYDQELMGQGKLTNPISIASKDTVALPMEFGLRLGQLQKKHSTLFNSQNAAFDFNGVATAKHPLKTIRKDIATTLHFNVKDILSEHVFNEYVVFGEIALEKIKPFSQKGITKTDLQLSVEIFNNQAFDFQIEEVALALFSKKSQKVVVEGFMNTKVHAKSQKLTKIPIDITSNNLNIFGDIGRFFLGRNDATYVGVGHMTVRINEHLFKLPIDREFDIKTQLFGNKAFKPYAPLP